MFETLKILMREELEKEKQEAVQEAVQETAKETARETEKKTIEKLLKKGKMSVKEIAECCTEFSEEEIQEMEEEITQTV